MSLIIAAIIIVSASVPSKLFAHLQTHYSYAFSAAGDAGGLLPWRENRAIPNFAGIVATVYPRFAQGKPLPRPCGEVDCTAI